MHPMRRGTKSVNFPDENLLHATFYDLAETRQWIVLPDHQTNVKPEGAGSWAQGGTAEHKLQNKSPYNRIVKAQDTHQRRSRRLEGKEAGE